MMERRLSVLKICIRIHFESFRLLLFFFKSHAILRHICVQLFGEFFLRNALCRFFFFSLTIIEGKKIGIRREHDSREKYLAHGK